MERLFASFLSDYTEPAPKGFKRIFMHLFNDILGEDENLVLTSSRISYRFGNEKSRAEKKQ